MVKGIAKYGFRSGVLPRPRHVVPKIKAKFEQDEEARLKTGFSDPAMVPRGSSANPPGPKSPSVREILQNSAKSPSQDRVMDTKHKEWKGLSAEIRRKYLQDALETESAVAQKRAAKKQQRHEAGLALREKLSRVEESPATLLTMPSIEESLVAGAMVVPRTKQETALLGLKREANRKQTELDQAERRDRNLLELYQSTKTFIVTEEELDAAVDKAFSASNASIPSSNLALVMSPLAMQDRIAKTTLRKNQNEISQALMGVTSTEDPGLGEVRRALDGSWQSWLENQHVDEEASVDPAQQSTELN